MTEFVGADLWTRIRRESDSASHRSAAVAYATDATAITFARGDIVVVDASDAAIAGGRTSVEALQRLLEREVRLYSVPNLHAKVFVFDATVIAGSSNLSAASQQTLIEAAVCTRDPQVARQATNFIEGLARAGTPIDQQFLQRAAEIPVVRSALQPQSPTAVGRLWRLEVTPDGGALLRAYFIALMEAQLGTLRANQPFQLWHGNFATHIATGRLRQSGRDYMLSDNGVRYFTERRSPRIVALVPQFTQAVRTGDESVLPEEVTRRTLVPLAT